MFTFVLAAAAVLSISAQKEQLKTGDHFEYGGNGYTIVGENLIENPSFDNGVTGWLGGDGNPLGGATWNSTGGADGGAYIIPQDNQGKGGNKSIGTAWPLEIGKTYVFSYYINNTSNTAAVEKEGYIVTSQTNSPRGDETLTLMYGHEDADLAWTQNIVVTEAQFSYLQFCARWLSGQHGFDAFILAEVVQDADPKELSDLVANCEEWLNNGFDEPSEESVDAFKSVIEEAQATLDLEAPTAAQFNAMIAKLSEALLDYRMANADEDHVVDVTSRYIKNPDFGNGMVDWDIVNSAVNNGCNIRVQSYFQEVTDRVLEINGNPTTLTSAKQTVKGLPKGYYIFSVDCVMSHSADLEDAESKTGASIICNGAELDMKTKEMTASDAAYADAHPERFEITGVVTEDEITIGLIGAPGTSFSYVAIDNVKLEYAGFNVGVYLQALTEEVAQYIEDHYDELLPAIVYALEDEAINANSVLGTSEEEMKAEYDKFDALYREAKNSLVKMQELSDAVTALVELLETTEYPGAAAAEKACEDALALIDHQDENATYQDILNMIDAIAKAERDYMLSQEATHETPADYTFLITNPQVYTNNAGWEGSTPGYEYNVAEFYNMDWDMYQTVTDLPNGLYEVGMYGFFRTGANDGGEAYRNGGENLIAKLYANKSVTSVMSLYTYTETECGCTGSGTNGYINVRQYADEAFQNGFYGENKVKVIVTDGTLTIGVRGTGHENTSWFAFRDFSLKYFGEATDADKAAIFSTADEAAKKLFANLLPGDLADFQKICSDAAANPDVMAGYEDLLAALDVYEPIAATTASFMNGTFQALKDDATALSESPAAVAAAAASFIDAIVTASDAKSDILEGLKEQAAAYLEYAEYVEEVVADVKNASRNGYASQYVTVVNEIIAANEAILKEKFYDAATVQDRQSRLVNAVTAMQKSALLKVAPGSDVTSMLISNPNIDDSTPTGWNIILGTGNQPTNAGQNWAGDANNRYLDSWNGTAGKLNFTAYQILTDIPNGTYSLSCHGRSSGEHAYLFASVAPYTDEKNDSTMAIAVRDESTYWVEFPNDADQRGELWLADSLVWANGGEMTDIFNAHDGIGWGWAIRTIDEVVVKNHTMTFGITCDSTLTQKAGYTGTWYSADEFTLTLKSLGDNSDYVIDTQILNAEAEPARIEFFTTDGRQIAEPQKGVNIIRTVRADGYIETKKVLVR